MTSSAAEPLVFDRVRVVDDGRTRDMSTGEFLALPLKTRIRFILERNLEFTNRGSAVDYREALRSLRTAKLDNA